MIELETSAQIEAYCLEKYAEISPPLRALMDADEDNGVMAISFSFVRVFCEHMIAAIEKDSGRPLTMAEKLMKISQCTEAASAMVADSVQIVKLSIVPVEDARKELDVLLKRASR